MDTYAADVTQLVASSTCATRSTSAIRPAAAKSRAMSRGHEPGRVAKAVLIGAVPPLMVKTDANPGGTPIEVFDGFRDGARRPTAPQFYLDIASGRSTASTGPACSSSKA